MGLIWVVIKRLLIGLQVVVGIAIAMLLVLCLIVVDVAAGLISRCIEVKGLLLVVILGVQKRCLKYTCSASYIISATIRGPLWCWFVKVNSIWCGIIIV